MAKAKHGVGAYLFVGLVALATGMLAGDFAYQRPAGSIIPAPDSFTGLSRYFATLPGEASGTNSKGQPTPADWYSNKRAG